MPFADKAYLALVIISFVGFMATLAYGGIVSRPAPRQATKPGRPAESRDRRAA